MHNVLLVYKQLSFQFDENGQLLPFSKDDQIVHVLSYDEKPGIQAIANTTKDLPPDKNHKTISRDYEDKIRLVLDAYHWKYRLDEIEPREELQVDTLTLKK